MLNQNVTDNLPTIKEAWPTMPADAHMGLLRGIVGTSTRSKAFYFQIEGQSALGARRRGLRSLMSQLAKLRISLSPHSLHRLPGVKVNHRTEWKHLMT